MKVKLFQLFMLILFIVFFVEVNAKRHARWPKNKDGIANVYFVINGFCKLFNAIYGLIAKLFFS